MSSRRRSGFTLVELMVSMALIMFMMAIISEAFVAGLKAFRDMKATADMAERLRAVGGMLRREIAADHFEARRRLSDPNFWSAGPPAEGFFRIYNGSPLVVDGSDPGELSLPLGSRLLNAYHTTDHMLHFTVKLRGNERGDFFASDLALAPAGTALATSPYLFGPRHYQENTTSYHSQWAEVAYFLRPTTDVTTGGQPRYGLYRRQFLLVQDNDLLGTTNSGNVFTAAPVALPTGVTNPNSIYPEMSCRVMGSNIYFNNPRDVTEPVRRYGMNPTNLAGTYNTTYTSPTTGGAINTYPTVYNDTGSTAYQNADLLLNDVLSFEVRVLPALYTGAASYTVSTPVTMTRTYPTATALYPAAGPAFVDLFDPFFTTVTTPTFTDNTTSPPTMSTYSYNLNGNNPSYPTGLNATGPRVYDTWSSQVEAQGGPNYSGYATGGSTAVSTGGNSYSTSSGGSPTSVPIYPGVVTATVTGGPGTVATTSTAPIMGMNCFFYNLNSEPTAMTQLNFSSLTPVFSRVDPAVNYPLNTNSNGGLTNIGATGLMATLPTTVQSTNAAAQWTGNLIVCAAGTYTFWTSSDDGSQLLIDGNVIVNNDGIHAWTTVSASVALTAGQHTFQVKYYQGPAVGAGVVAQYSGPDTGNVTTLIPAATTSAGPGVIIPAGSTVYTAGGQWTFNSTAALSILAVQVTIRIWDVKTSQTRQITIVQDL